MRNTPEANPIAKTAFGPIVGREVAGIQSFRRLRYAKPPVGALRFMPCEQVEPWIAPLECAGPSVVAPQHPSRLEAVMGAYPAQQDEDCLHLDIWRPADCGEQTPVLVFIHGGAFLTGGGAFECYDGAEIARQTGLIVINVSHRLGVLGFLPIPGVAPANLGYQDQIAALAFVRKIAPGLGGDADNITVIGQSAGAYTIALMLADSAARANFTRAAMLSAPLGLDMSTSQGMTEISDLFLRHLDIDPGDAEALRAVPVERILDGQRAILVATMAPGKVSPPLGPVIDGTLIPAAPIEQLRAGGPLTQAILIGTTREEMAAFYCNNPELAAAAPGITRAAFEKRFGEHAEAEMARAAAHRAPAEPLALLADIKGEELFYEGTRSLAETHVARGGKAWCYSFDWQSPAPGLGACHCIDLPFLFGTFSTMANAPMIAGAAPREIADLGHHFRHAIAAFARTGMPTGADLPEWPEYGESGATLRFDRKITLA